jgi:hypothetical protein
MTEREFGNFSQWPLKELLKKARSFTVGDFRGAEIQAEINRRYAVRNQRYSLVNVISTVVIAFGTIAGILYALDRGIYVGSTSHMVQGLIYMDCRHLFITGISESPAHGGSLEQVPQFRGAQSPNESPKLYCRFFGE